MHFDEVFASVGDFGKYQKILYVATCFPILFGALSYMAPVFTLAVPKHRCAIPGLRNDTYAIQTEQHRILVDTMIPTKNGEYSKCEIYKPEIDLSSLMDAIDVNSTRLLLQENVTSCSEWVYDKSTFHSTVVTETNLVCSRTIFHAHAITATNLGNLVATLTSGYFSDRFGRKPVYMFCIVTILIASLLMLWVPHIWAFIAFRFILGLNLMFTIDFVYILEFIGPTRRLACSMFLNNVWAFAFFIQAGLAYGLREWRHLQLVTSLPVALFLIYWRFLPESPRWLFYKQKEKQAKEVIGRIAEVNSVTFNLEMLNELETNNCDDRKRSGHIMDLVKSRTLLIRCVVVLSNWFVVTIMYYGLSLNVSNLSGNIYLNYVYLALAESAAYMFCIPAVAKVGRKRFHCFCMVLGGVALLMTPLPLKYGTDATQWITTLLSMVGKFMSSAAFATLFLYTNELFPTVVRNRVTGAAVFSSSVAGMIAPYLVELANLLEGRIVKILPMLVFGGCALVVGLLALHLPETKKKQLPDTIDEAKTFLSLEVKNKTDGELCGKPKKTDKTNL